MLDYMDVAQTGLIHWNKKKLLIDNLTYLVNAADEPGGYLRAAYSCIDEFSSAYLKKLYEEPTHYIIKQGKIYYPDFNNGLIIHENGRKKTFRKDSTDKYVKTVWIFGDSRVSGMLIENRYTISGILQEKIYEKDLLYRVENCGIPGRDIERMVEQIKETEVCEGDIVILGTGFYEYHGDPVFNAFVWSTFIKDAYSFCNKKNVEFLYVNLPTILEMNNLTDEEKKLLEIFNTTEFTEYSQSKLIRFNELISYYCSCNGIGYKNYSTYFQKRYEYGMCFINLHHYGPNGNMLIADAILEYIEIIELAKTINLNKIKDAVAERIQKQEVIKNGLDSETEIKEYLREVRRKIWWNSSAKTGCIVMNANPFTLGHMYLVKKSLEYVDYLIVMVVEEDASDFSFKDRLNMVSANLEDFKNVIVIPSGKFCISKTTFPEYFKKEDMQNDKIDSRDDLTIFSTQIAPALNVKVRFIGDEPNDAVTRQYNEQMRQILSLYNLEVVEITRARSNNVPVSASQVRKFVNERNWEGVKTLVPECTYHYLEKLCTK